MNDEYPEPMEYELEDDGSSDEDNYDIEDDDDAEDRDDLDAVDELWMSQQENDNDSI
jgi:hypothetical protein